MKILDLNDENFGTQFLEATGLKAGDSINIITPQFDRDDGVEPMAPLPKDRLDMWVKLPYLLPHALKTMGFQKWDDVLPNGEKGVLWLIPGSWFSSIPNGFEVMCIDGKVLLWDENSCDDDTRFGALAYGIVSKRENKKES